MYFLNLKLEPLSHYLLNQLLDVLIYMILVASRPLLPLLQLISLILFLVFPQHLDYYLKGGSFFPFLLNNWVFIIQFPRNKEGAKLFGLINQLGPLVVPSILEVGKVLPFIGLPFFPWFRLTLFH